MGVVSILICLTDEVNRECSSDRFCDNDRECVDGRCVDLASTSLWLVFFVCFAIIAFIVCILIIVKNHINKLYIV